IEQYTHKGKEVAIEGKLISRSYTNEMGVKCYVTEIVATEILLLGSKNEPTPLNEMEVTADEVNANPSMDDTSANGKTTEAQQGKKPQGSTRKRTPKSNQKVA
ncbi:MAG: single-stranded DNA-binding protein, partial [Croceitalea sp.]|nr:single-stranded DNA-binding protein [Croceitalea sp.]